MSPAGEHLARRVEDKLRREARREIERRARAKAELIGKRIAAITIRVRRAAGAAARRAASSRSPGD
jgi:predicted metal-dependent hydrolase